MNKMLVMHHARLIFPKIVRSKYGMTCVHVLNSGSPGSTVWGRRRTQFPNRIDFDQYLIYTYTPLLNPSVPLDTPSKIFINPDQGLFSLACVNLTAGQQRRTGDAMKGAEGARARRPEGVAPLLQSPPLKERSTAYAPGWKKSR